METFDGTASVGSLGADILTYFWLFNDGSSDASAITDHVYDEPGIYEVTLVIVDDTGCSDTSTTHVHVAPPPYVLLHEPTSPVCLGDTLDFNPQIESTPISIYDPEPFPILDVSLSLFPITIEQFELGAVVTSLSDIQAICVDIEHSFMGDLVLELKCPSDSSMLLHAGSGGGTFVGDANDDDNGSPTLGMCWNYCWNPTATSGTWADNAIGGTTPNVMPSSEGTSLVPGTYSSVDPFDHLLGCPMNGTWTLVVTDENDSDNGFLCDWHLLFAGEPLPMPWPSTTTVISAQVSTSCDSSYWSGPAIVSMGSPCTSVQAVPTEGGSFIYDLVLLDDHGCSFAYSVPIEVLEFPAPAIQGPSLPAFGGVEIYSVDQQPDAVFHWTASSGSEMVGEDTHLVHVIWNTPGSNWIAVEVTISGCVLQDTLWLEGFVGIAELGRQGVSVHPNPADDLVTITIKEQSSETTFVRLLDMSGRSVHHGLIPQGQHATHLVTSAIPTGPYVLELTTTRSVINIPLVVQH